MHPAFVIVLILIAALSVGGYFFKNTWWAQDGAGHPPAATEATEAAVQPQTLQEEAEAHLDRLTEARPGPVAVEKADHFVRPDQLLALPDEKAVELLTLEQILEDPAMDPDRPIALLREMEQVEMVTPEEIIAEVGGDLDGTVKVLEGDSVRELTVRSLLEKYERDSDARISVVRSVEYMEKTSPRELQQQGSLHPDEPLKVIRKPFRADSATVGELLVGQQTLSAESIVYVHTVRDDDAQGIWGIVHDGLIENFARGVALRRGEGIDTYRVPIPRDADERLADDSSSFLGKLIDRKARETYVYNYRERRMGRNPDLVSPGQELVVVQFSPGELIDIYTHFAERQSDTDRSAEPQS